MLAIFLINLDSRPDRLAYVSAQLSALDLPFVRIQAIVGKDLTQEEQLLFDKERFIIEYKKPVTLGEIGCAMSHRLIWQKMLDEDIKYALILEDDIDISPELVNFLNEPRHYQAFDFLNLSSNVPYCPDEAVLKELEQKNMTKRPDVWQSRHLWKRIEWRNKWRIFKLHFFGQFICCECNPAPALGSGYILSKKGARALFKTSEKMYYPVDLTWRFSGGMLRQGFLACPLIVQTLADTDIQGRDVPYKMTLTQKIKRFFMKTRHTSRHSDVKKMYGWSKL